MQTSASSVMTIHLARDLILEDCRAKCHGGGAIDVAPAMRPRLDAMEEQAQGRSSTDMALVAVSLNIGGRNTNPLEFLLDGDSSKDGLSATRARVRAQEAMVDAECGPARMVSTERSIVDEIISSIISELGGDRKYFDALLSSATWADVYNQVRSDKPGLFNALNLTTLQLTRPSVIETPTDCAHITSREGYLRAWGAWCALACIVYHSCSFDQGRK